MNKQSGFAFTIFVLGVFVLSWSTPVKAYEGFDNGGGAGEPGCASCHSSLANFGPAHTTHAAPVDSCSSCHGSGGRDNPPLSACVQCHGREADGGNDNISAGIGRGLRLHHVTVNASACDNCHSDATSPTNVGEDILPAFYASALNSAGLDTCDGSEENFVSRSVSLDNDGDGLTDSADPDCVTNRAPVADPNGPYNASVDSPVNFDGSGSSDPDGTIAAYDWDFGDGNTGAGVTPTHSYVVDGTYTVTLTVTDDAGATDTQTTTATITALPLPPVADANGPYAGVVGTPINFDGTGSSDADGTITTYAWNFGDGGTGNGTTPTHTYSVDGMFTVTLTVTDNDGQSASDTSTATINPAGSNTPPVADANGPYTGTEGVAVQFSSAGSMDADGAIVAYNWDFGDGNRSSLENPSHVFVVAGNYTVTLTVTDNDSDTGTDMTSATIEAPVVNTPPVADANGPYSALVDAAIRFDGSASTDADGAIVRYDWDFGDGTTADDAGPAPSHAYGAAGNYTVTLTVADDMGATGSATAAVSISDPVPVTDGETQYNDYCSSCHGDPWTGRAVDSTLPGLRRVTGARACVIDGSIFGTYVFPNGAPGMGFLQDLVINGTIDTVEIAEYLNGQPVTGEAYYVTACAGCHGNDGRGGRTGESVLGESAHETREALNEESTMRYLACLPDSDIEAIATFLGGNSSGNDDDEEDSHSGGGASGLLFLALLSIGGLFRPRSRRKRPYCVTSGQRVTLNPERCGGQGRTDSRQIGKADLDAAGAPQG